MVLRRAVPPLLCVLFLLIGCGSGPSNTSSPIGSSRPSGSVHGGQQPVVGAAIQLYTIGTTGNGSAATPLLTSTVTSDSTGSFSITGLYSCTNATQVYIVATGGNPGLSAANPDIALMAALGPCSSLASSTFINIDELTTVAAVSALAPYMSSTSPTSSIGGSSAADNGLFYAFILADQFVNTATGTSPGPSAPSGYTVPTAELNTLADILSACINSTGGVAGDGSLCGQLFSLTTISPNAAPTNTIQAMLNIANNPTLNISSLFALVPPTPPFQPTLLSAPSTFQVALTPPAGGSALQVTPQSATFPATVADSGVGFTSPAESFTLTNNGSSTVTVSSISVTGASGATFTIPPQSCSPPLDAGGSCTFTVTASPTQVGADSGTLTINSSASATALSVPLSITGLAPGNSTATLSPSSITFNIWGANADLTLANTGSAPLNFGYAGAAATGGEQDQHHYTISSNNCTAPIAAGSPCTFSVQNLLTLPYSSYTGGLPTGVTGQAYVHDDASSGAGFQSNNILTNSSSILLQNNVVNGTVSFPPNQVGYSQTAAIELANVSTQFVGGQPTTVVSGSPAASLTIGGANPGDFSVSAVTTSVSPNPSPSCPGGTSVCNITVTFDPTAAGTRTAELSLDSGGSTTGQYILLTGTAAGSGPSFATSGGLSITSYLPVNADPKSVGSAAVVITNTGTTTLTLTAAFTGANPSRFVADVSQCRSVAPQATCTVTVTASATLLGSYSGALVLTDAASSASATLGVSIRTSNWIPTFSLGSPYAFPSQTVNTTSAAVSFNITDPYGYPIGDAMSLSLPANSNFTLPSGSSCPAGPQPCTLSIAFSPHTTGTIQEILTITDQTTGASNMVSLSGNATP